MPRSHGRRLDNWIRVCGTTYPNPVSERDGYLFLGFVYLVHFPMYHKCTDIRLSSIAGQCFLGWTNISLSSCRSTSISTNGFRAANFKSNIWPSRLRLILTVLISPLFSTINTQILLVLFLICRPMVTILKWSVRHLGWYSQWLRDSYI